MSFKPVVRFAVMSDTHYDVDKPYRCERFRSAMKGVYSYCEKEEYKALDALYIVGDFTNVGAREQMELLKEDCDNYVKSQTQLVLTLANHELHYGESEEKALADFADVFKMPVDRHLVINGYHFISLSTTNNGGVWHDSFTEAKKEFLKAELEKAAADNATRPIFVFQHPGIRGTTPGGNFGNPGLLPVFSNYPQVIDFSGHSHLAVNDPREIDQKDFTAVSTGGLADIGIRCGSIYNHIDAEGYNPTQYAQMLLVEVDAQDRVRIRIYDVVEGKFFDDDRIICCAHDKEKYVYTDKRKETAAIPYFEADAKAELLCENDTVKVSFPRALCENDKIWTYNIRLLNENNELVAEKTISSVFMAYNPKEVYSASFNEIAEPVKTAEIYAIGFWENVSEPLKAQ